MDNQGREIVIPHYRIRLFRESGSTLEETFVLHEDAVDFVKFNSEKIYPFIEVDELNKEGQWEFLESWARH